MRGITPVEELNIKEISKNIKNTYDEKINKAAEENRNRNIEELKYLSLDSIANNTRGISCYSPYLFDFEFIMDRLKNDYDMDKRIESIEVKSDIAKQLEKMKTVPSFSTECHIESKYGLNCSSLKSFVLKNIFRQKKYRLVFHDRDATFDEKYCKMDIKQFIYVSIFLIIIFALSFKFSNFAFMIISGVLEVVVFFIWAMLG